MRTSQYRCVVTGWRTYIHDHIKGNPTPYWALTIDHATPLTQEKTKASVWLKTNLQVICHAVNLVKGMESDKDVKR